MVGKEGGMTSNLGDWEGHNPTEVDGKLGRKKPKGT